MYHNVPRNTKRLRSSLIIDILKRMLAIFLDSETNGLNPKLHRVVEIAFDIVDLSTGASKLKYQTLISQEVADWNKSDQESLKINGFTWDEVSLGKPLKQVSKEIIDHFTAHGIKRGKAVFICQNPSFDRVFFSQIVDPKTQEHLHWPYHWLDLASMHWALTINKAKSGTGPLPWETGLSKDKIASFYKLPPEEKPHRAANGVAHLIQCYKAVVPFPNCV